MRLTDGTNQINFGLWDITNYRLKWYKSSYCITSFSDGIRLGGSSDSHVVIKGGNVGIGTTSPSKLGSKWIPGNISCRAYNTFEQK